MSISNITELKINQKNQNLKVVAFKLMCEQIESIQQLCNEGYYPSVSETVRIAILDYIDYLLQITNNNKTDFWIDFNLLENYAVKNALKKSACTKMPPSLLNLVNYFVKRHPFGNRTNFIRLAISRFLTLENQIYRPWMNQSESKSNVLRKIEQYYS